MGGKGCTLKSAACVTVGLRLAARVSSLPRQRRIYPTPGQVDGAISSTLRRPMRRRRRWWRRSRFPGTWSAGWTCAPSPGTARGCAARTQRWTCARAAGSAAVSNGNATHSAACASSLHAQQARRGSSARAAAALTRHTSHRAGSSSRSCARGWACLQGGQTASSVVPLRSKRVAETLQRRITANCRTPKPSSYPHPTPTTNA